MIPMDREQVLSQLRERIVGVAASRLSKEVAEDLTQEVMIVLHEKYALRFKIWDTRRKSLRRAEHTPVSLDEIQVADKAGHPGIEIERKQLLAQLMEAIDSLGPRCRQLFLWKLEEKTFQEIQRLFGVSSINTIYTWDFRCRKQLIQKMGGAWEHKREGKKQ